jgi:hypothetical protein
MGLPRSLVKAISAIMLTVICGTAATGYAAPAKEPGKEAPKTDPRYEELRKRGTKAAKEGRFAEAIEVWKAAYALHPSYEVACAIGRTEMLGQANALGGALWLTRCVHLAPVPDRAQKGAAKELEEQQKEILLRDMARARVGALRITADAGATVEVDGRSVGAAPFEDEVFVMPGAHRVTVSLGRRSRSVDLKVAAGESRAVDLSLPPLPATPERALGAGRVTKDALFYAGLGVGAVGLGLTVGFGAAAIRARGEAEQVATSFNERFGDRPCTSMSIPGCGELGGIADRINTFTAVSLVGFSAALAGGVMVTYAIVRPRGKASERGVQAAFMGAPGGGGMMFVGRF